MLQVSQALTVCQELRVSQVSLENQESQVGMENLGLRERWVSWACLETGDQKVCLGDM